MRPPSESVIPAKAGIPLTLRDSGFRRDDGWSFILMLVIMMLMVMGFVVMVVMMGVGGNHARG